MITSILKNNISLAPWTTFKVGGPAQWFAEPNSVEQIAQLQQWAQAQSLPVFLLGQGSNVVVSDDGFPGLIIHLGKNFGAWQINGSQISAQAGCLLHKIVTESVKSQLAGIEHLGGIPGTIGGGAFINAGAYSQDLSQVISSVTSLNDAGETITRTNEQCDFGYRRSVFTSNSEWILSVNLQLQPDPVSDLASSMKTTLLKRKTQQPIELPNAGSMFKRPKDNFAGALIERAGLKGLQVGAAQVSPKHANFIVNLGGATAQDIWNLSSEVITRVQKESGIVLEREVIFLGKF